MKIRFFEFSNFSLSSVNVAVLFLVFLVSDL